jgi:hypothetical protein
VCLTGPAWFPVLPFAGRSLCMTLYIQATVGVCLLWGMLCVHTGGWWLCCRVSAAAGREGASYLVADTGWCSGGSLLGCQHLQHNNSSSSSACAQVLLPACTHCCVCWLDPPICV